MEITRDDAQLQLENAKKFIEEAEKTMQKMIQGAGGKQKNDADERRN